MASVKAEGIDLFVNQLGNLAKDLTEVNRGALGAMAEYVADAIGNAIQSMPVRGDDEYGTAKHKLYGATQSEKQQIAENFGIAPFKTRGGNHDTSIGFTGYVDTPSTRFNDRIPTGMLMQCIEYGTEFRQGTLTITAAIKKTKNAPEKAQEYIDKEINKIMK